MKRIGTALMIALLCSCSEPQNSPELDTDEVHNSATAEGKHEGPLPDMAFAASEHDFGKITQGERVRFAFTFTNTGQSNLLIANAKGSCGCTVPEWPREPIAPGKTGTISVEFNSEGKHGQQEKAVTIATNCEPATKVVRIKAEIIVPEQAQ